MAVHEENMQSISAIASQRPSDVKSAVAGAVYPQSEEPAMIHPLTQAIVKLRNNGMIDIFVTDDNGIRIDPATKTINLMSNGIKEHASYHFAWLDSYAAWVNMNWRITVQGNVYITAQGNVDVECNGSFTAHSKGDMRLQSDSHMYLNAPEIDID
jgi:hypothetical protein